MKYLQTVKEFAQLKPGQLIYRWFGDLNIYRVQDVIKYDDFVNVQLVDEDTSDIKHLTITNQNIDDHDFYYADRSVIIDEIKGSIIWLKDRIHMKEKEIDGDKKGISELKDMLARI